MERSVICEFGKNSRESVMSAARAGIATGRAPKLALRLDEENKQLRIENERLKLELGHRCRQVNGYRKQYFTWLMNPPPGPSIWARLKDNGLDLLCAGFIVGGTVFTVIWLTIIHNMFLR